MSRHYISLFKRTFFVFHYVCVSICVCGYMCVWVYGGQRRMADPLELELQAAVSCLMWVLGIELGSPGGAAHAELSSPFYFFLKDSLFVFKWQSILGDGSG